MNYQIITDIEKLSLFIEWLPQLKVHEKFYVALFARKKYAPDSLLSSDKSQIKRFLTTTDRLYEKLFQLECKLSAYIHRKKGKIISYVPQESLAVYISPNPRDLKKATWFSVKKLITLLENDNQSYNPHAEVLSEIQKTKSRTYVIDFDIDDENYSDAKIIQELSSIVNLEAVDILRTRGGFHILVKPQLVHKEFEKTFYNNIVKSFGVDKSGDQLIPIPGCYQGGFTPYFI